MDDIRARVSQRKRSSHLKVCQMVKVPHTEEQRRQWHRKLVNCRLCQVICIQVAGT